MTWERGEGRQERGEGEGERGEEEGEQYYIMTIDRQCVGKDSEQSVPHLPPASSLPLAER